MLIDTPRYRSHFFNRTPATIWRVSYFSLNAVQIPEMVVEVTVHPTPMSTEAKLDVDSSVQRCTSPYITLTGM